MNRGEIQGQKGDEAHHRGGGAVENGGDRDFGDGGRMEEKND